MANYKIIEGKELRPSGPKSFVSPEDLTDELAEFYIKKNPALLGTVIEKIGSNKVENKKETTTKKPQPKKVSTNKKVKSKK